MPTVPITVRPSSDSVIAVPSVKVRPDAALVTVSGRPSRPAPSAPKAPPVTVTMLLAPLEAKLSAPLSSEAPGTSVSAPLLATVLNSPATVVAPPLNVIAVEPGTSLAPPVVCTPGVSSTPAVAALAVTVGAVGMSSLTVMLRCRT